MRSRSNTKVTPARRSYNIKRTEQMWVTMGNDSKRRTFEALGSKLAVGLKEAEDALNWFLCSTNLFPGQPTKKSSLS
jgi:hypothetical protein